MVGVPPEESRGLDAKVYFTRFAGECRPVCFGHSDPTMLSYAEGQETNHSAFGELAVLGWGPSALQISCPQSGLESLGSLRPGIKDIKRSVLHCLCPVEEIKVARPQNDLKPKIIVIRNVYQASP
jgi:hypothetical protein